MMAVESKTCVEVIFRSASGHITAREITVCPCLKIVFSSVVQNFLQLNRNQGERLGCPDPNSAALPLGLALQQVRFTWKNSRNA